MADVNLPSINELGQMASLPFAQFQQAKRNIDLATQFQNQNLQQGEYGLQKALMDNNYQAANDPVRLLSNQQDLGIKTSEGIIKGVEANQRRNLAPLEEEEKKQKFVTGLSESQLANFYTRAEMDSQNDSLPEAQRAAAREAQGRSFKELSARAKAKDTAALSAEDNASRERIAAGNNATSIANNQATNAAREAVAKSRQKASQTVQERLMGAKTSDARVGVYMGASEEATLRGDDELAAIYKSKAAEERGITTNNKLGAAGINATKELDVAETQRTGIATYKDNPLPAPPVSRDLPRRNSQMEPPITRPVAPSQPVPGMSGRQGPTNTSEANMAANIRADTAPNPADIRKEIAQLTSDAADPKKPLSPSDRQLLLAQALQLKKQLDIYSTPAAQPAPVAPAQPKPASGPQAGQSYKGYKFKGGDPSDKNNWTKE